MHFLKEIPVHEMQKLRKEEEKKEEWKKEIRKERRVKKGKKKGKKSRRRKEEGKKERRKERRVKEGKKSGRRKVIPSYTVEWRGTERRGALEPWHRCQWSTGASQFNYPIMMS